MSARLILCVSLLLVGDLFAQVPSNVGDWPQWRGPNRDAISKDTGLLKEWKPGGPRLVYQRRALGSGFSSVSLANGRIFTMGDLDGSQHVIALDQASGELLWLAQVGGTHQADYAGPRGTPTTDGELLYAIGTDGNLVCLEAATGKERWRRNMERDLGGQMMSGWRWSESPLVDGERVLVTPGARDAAIVALDKKTGKEIWRAAVPELGSKGRDGAAYSSIVISEGAGVKQYVQLLGRGVVGVRASDGKFLWGNNSVANGTANIATPVVKGDYVFASTGYQTGSVLLKLQKQGDGVQASEVYFLDNRTFQNHHGGFVLVGDHIYGGHGHRNGFPIAIEFATGKVVWGGEGTRAEGRGSAAVAYADGHVYMRYEDGVVILVEATPTGYKPKGSFTIPNVTRPSWPHPVVAGGRLYLREQDTLYVYDVKG